MLSGRIPPLLIIFFMYCDNKFNLFLRKTNDLDEYMSAKWGFFTHEGRKSVNKMLKKVSGLCVSKVHLSGFVDVPEHGCGIGGREDGRQVPGEGA